MTDEKRDTVKHDKASRVSRAKGRTRGMMIVLMGKHRLDTGLDTFEVVADENEALVNDADIQAWLSETGFIGTVFPVRFQRGKESMRRWFAQAKQETLVITHG